MKLRRKQRLMLIAAVVVLSGAMVAYAATLFTQTIPGQTFNVVTLTAGSCGGSLVLNSGASEVPAYAGSPSYLQYDCGGGPGQQAFSSTGTTSTTATATPTFTLPSGWSLSVQGYGDGCFAVGNTILTSGTPVGLTGGSTYEYCLTSSSASTFTSFAITWSQ